ncbi:MAG TPA: ferritin-like domain-containing protein [Candidatus Cybelea sp.]|nr:ferritin-like domain-containing protein [Candidatus Cybelea sp.]
MIVSAPAQVQSREELLYLLARASELEHDLACAYLYAGYSIKLHPEEGGLTFEEHKAVRGWKQQIAHVAVEEMLHLAQVSNILTAVGGAPHFMRADFPLPPTAFPFGIEISLEPLSRSILERFMAYEMPAPNDVPVHLRPRCERIRSEATAEIDHAEIVRQQNALEPFDIDFRTIGEFYRKIESAFDVIEPDRLFIGDPADQARPAFLDLQHKLIPVRDVASARRAIERIVEQGEAPPRHHPDAHFFVFNHILDEYDELSQRARDENRVFEPFRPLVSNPKTRGFGSDDRANRITDGLAHELGELFNSTYELMLTMLVRFFAHGGEKEEELRMLARGTLRLMASGLRPLGEALAQTPAGPEYPGKNAGPSFGLAQNVHLLAHKGAAWIYFYERLYDLQTRLTHLSNEESVPQEVQEAAAVLESVAEHIAPFIPKKFAEVVRADCGERNARTSIRPDCDGPLIVRNLRKLTNSKGKALPVRPIVALCRCGGSKLKPYCDGTHATNGFCSKKTPDRAPDRLDTYEGKEIVVLDNRGTCCHFGNCTDHLPQVFHQPPAVWATPDAASAGEVEAIVRACPSGALGFVKDGVTYEGEEREPEIYVAENASYYVRGNIELRGEPFNQGASREHYALCRCGHSKNKPFCDGTHWYIGFKDPDN